MKKILLLIAMFAGFTAAKADNKIYFEKTSYDVVKGSSVIIPVCFQCDNVAGGVKAIQCNWALTPGSGASGLTNDVDNLAKADGRYTGTVVASFAGAVLGYAFGSANPLIGDDGPLWLVKFDAADDATGSYTFSLSDAWVNIGGTQIDCVPASAQVTINIVDYVTIDENEAFTPTAISGKDVQVIRSFEANKYYTVCLPFNLTLAMRKNIFGDALEAYTFSGSECVFDDTILPDGKFTSMTINFAAAKTTGAASVTRIAANTPFILKPSVSVTNPTFTGVGVVEGTPVTAKTDDSCGSVISFVGTYAPNTIVPENSLYLKDAKLYASKGGTKMKGTRAYIDLQDFYTQNNGYINVKLNIDGIETAIDAIDEDLKAEGWFDLNGRKLAQKPTMRGIYINNGKKVVVK